MRAFRSALLIAVSLLAVPVGTHVYAQDSSNRTELKRTDLTGAPGMEVISSIIEVKPGNEVMRHVHHGVESGYVLQGAMIQAPGKEPSMQGQVSLRLEPRSSAILLTDSSEVLHDN